MKGFNNCGLALAALTLLASSASADRNDPGSLLIYPAVSTSAGGPGLTASGDLTLFSITNTSSTESVRVHVIYVDGDDCSKTNLFETLTPNDTFTAITNSWIPASGAGYIYAYALSMSGQPVDFDHLVGSGALISPYAGGSARYNAMVFEGQTGHGNTTDLDSDGLRDLDGQEYSATPDRVLIPSFIGQDAKAFGGNLVLLGLTGTKFDTTADLLIYNDNEQVFSSQVTFDCWDIRPLLSISGIFRNDFLHMNTTNDPDEIRGAPSLESGWFIMDGAVANSSTTTIADPAFLALYLESTPFYGLSATLPFTLGEQTNGQILSQSLSGN